MTELTARLRSRKAFGRSIYDARYSMLTDPDPDCIAAADEIEKLEADLALATTDGFTDAMVDAAAESLAVIWPGRRPGECTVGMPLEMRRRIKHAARDALAVAYLWRDTQTREKPFLSFEDEHMIDNPKDPDTKTIERMAAEAWERRAEAAEARIKRITAECSAVARVLDDVAAKLEQADASLEQAEAETIERCAQVADSIDSVNGIGDKIRDLLRLMS